MRFAFGLIALGCLHFAFPLVGTETTEHRRALLINASTDSSHGKVISELAVTLEKKGFIVTRIKQPQKAGGDVYEKWVRALPTLGANILYYCGQLDVVKSNDGKRNLYAFQIAGHQPLPQVTKPTGRERPEEPGLTTARLSQKLGNNSARQNLVVIDCMGFNTGQADWTQHFTSASGSAKGNFLTTFFPGKQAFHPSVKEPVELGSVLAAELASALEQDKELPASFNKFSHKYTPRYESVFRLLHKPAEVCSPPGQIQEGRFAGDQWVDPLGVCFVWCPAGKYTMGDKAFEDAQPVGVTISKGFWIGKYELLLKEPIPLGGSPTVTNQRSDGSIHRWLPRASINSFTSLGGFLEWMEYRKETGQAFKGWTYDLPTEAEWEYACRAGSSDGLPAPLSELGKHGNFADLSLYNDRTKMPYLYATQETDDGYGRSFADAGRFEPNPWGIHDMLGNLAEYCADIYGASLPGGTDPLFHDTKPGRDFRERPVTRGGAWCSPWEYLHAAHRNPSVGLRQSQGVTPFAMEGIRLVIRQGDRRSRTGDELLDASNAKHASTKK